MTTTEQAPTNPVIRTTSLRAYPGWKVQEYADGTFDAIDTKSVAMSPVEQSFEDCIYFIRNGHPVIR